MPSVLPFGIAEPHYIPSAPNCEEQSTLNLPHRSYSQVLEYNAFRMRVRVQNSIRHTQLHFASRQIRLRTQLQQEREPTSQRCGRARQLRRTHYCFLEPRHQICPRDHFRSRQLHRLPRESVRSHAGLPNRRGHIAHPHRLLQSASAIDIDQPRIDVQLTADPANKLFPAVLPGQQAVIFAEHVRRTNDAGAGHDFAEHFLALGLHHGRKKPNPPSCEPTPNDA